MTRSSGARYIALPFPLHLIHYPPPICSVFNDEEQWRTPRRETLPADVDPDGNLSGGHCVGMGRVRALSSARAFLPAIVRHISHCSLHCPPHLHQPTHLPAHRLPGHAEASHSSSAFGGAQFWNALRSEDKLEGEVRGLLAGGCGPAIAGLLQPSSCDWVCLLWPAPHCRLCFACLKSPRNTPYQRTTCRPHVPTAEAKASYKRRGGQSLLVESDLKLARFLAGLHVSGRVHLVCWPLLAE